MADLLTRSYEKLDQGHQVVFNFSATCCFVSMVVKLRHKLKNKQTPKPWLSNPHLGKISWVLLKEFAWKMLESYWIID